MRNEQDKQREVQAPIHLVVAKSIKTEMKSVLLHFLQMLCAWLSMLRSTRNLAGFITFIVFFRYMLPLCKTVDDVIKALAVPLGIVVTSAITRTVERRKNP